VLEKNYLPISGVQNKSRCSKPVSCIAYARTKGVKNLKFSQNVHFDTTYLSQRTVIKSSAMRLRYLVVHIRRDTLYILKLIMLICYIIYIIRMRLHGKFGNEILWPMSIVVPKVDFGSIYHNIYTTIRNIQQSTRQCIKIKR